MDMERKIGKGGLGAQGVSSEAHPGREFRLHAADSGGLSEVLEQEKCLCVGLKNVTVGR